MIHYQNGKKYLLNLIDTPVSDYNFEFPFAFIIQNFRLFKGVVIFNTGYRGGRILGGASNLLALFYWGAKFFLQIHDGVAKF